MRKLSVILTVAVLILSCIIVPLGVITIIMAFELGLIYDGVLNILLTLFCAAFALIEVMECIRYNRKHPKRLSSGDAIECTEEIHTQDPRCTR